jgi:hypothetical protein
MQNEWKVSGTINPLKETSKTVYKGTTQLKGWISQRDIARLSNGDAVGGPKYIVGMKFTAIDPEIIKKIESMDNARQGAPSSIPATLKAAGNARTVPVGKRVEGMRDGYERQPTKS